MPDAHDIPDIDALVKVIASLQERIRRDGETIAANEIRTRTALIDPLLNALGWNTASPAMVIPQYRAEYGSVDYALSQWHQPTDHPSSPSSKPNA